MNERRIFRLITGRCRFYFAYAEDSRGHMDINFVHETLASAPGRLEKEEGAHPSPLYKTIDYFATSGHPY